jgi:hypothetical protein
MDPLGNETTNRDRGGPTRTVLGAGVAALVLGTAVWLGVSAGTGSARSTVAPRNTALPTISGTLSLGQTLAASQGMWSGTTPITYTYQWQQCDDTGASCTAEPAGTGATYIIVGNNVGNTMRVVVTATNSDGSATATSAATMKISGTLPVTTTGTTTTATTTSGTITTTTMSTTTTKSPAGCTTTGGTVPIANITSPAHLTIDAFTVTPSPVTFGTKALTVRVHISGCGGNVQGALVYVTAVPYNMFNIPREATTGADGYAMLTFNALPGFPVSQKQSVLVMFVRARKSGESILGGISARRLVSFTVRKS